LHLKPFSGVSLVLEDALKAQQVVLAQNVKPPLPVRGARPAE
jgi:hypothetical protein